MNNRDAQSESKATHPQPKDELEVSGEIGQIPKLPHEHDESVESQTGGRKLPDAKRAPNIGPQKKPLAGQQAKP
ncbi:MAG: hypothetical protein ABIS45_02480 [Burkholderiales bacterium]